MMQRLPTFKLLTTLNRLLYVFTIYMPNCQVISAFFSKKKKDDRRYSIIYHL